MMNGEVNSGTAYAASEVIPDQHLIAESFVLIKIDQPLLMHGHSEADFSFAEFAFGPLIALDLSL